MRTIFLVIAVLCGIQANHPAFAWGAAGHEYIGAIADRLLNEHAKKETNRILGFSLEVAAVWPDCARSVRHPNPGTFTYQSDPRFSECKAFESPTETARMEDYVKRN
jgi:S1/P1 Nuclease